MNETIDLFGDAPPPVEEKEMFHLNKAKKVAFDEFYTLDEDVHKAIERHAEDLRGKRVFANCDGTGSAFTRILGERANELGLDEFVSHAGPFQSEESRALLRRCDVVMTNPPFSLMVPFLSMLFEERVEFLIVFPSASLVMKQVFPRITSRELHTSGGYRAVHRFRVPPEYPKARIDKDGMPYGEVPCTWLTNFPDRGGRKRLEPTIKYDPAVHPTVGDNTIWVEKLSEIPIDYSGLMMVPFTYLGQMHEEIRVLDYMGYIRYRRENGRFSFARLLVRWKWAGTDGEMIQSSLDL